MRNEKGQFIKGHNKPSEWTRSGWRWTNESKENIMGRKRPKSKEIRGKISESLTGRIISEEHRKSLSNRDCYASGRNHWNWKGGISKERVTAYQRREYKEWRKAVFERDNYICVKCGSDSGDKNAHHVLSWKDHPEERYIVANGMTLCIPCHRTI